MSSQNSFIGRIIIAVVFVALGIFVYTHDDFRFDDESKSDLSAMANIYKRTSVLAVHDIKNNSMDYHFFGTMKECENAIDLIDGINEIKKFRIDSASFNTFCYSTNTDSAQ